MDIVVAVVYADRSAVMGEGQKGIFRGNAVGW